MPETRTPCYPLAPVTALLAALVMAAPSPAQEVAGERQPEQTTKIEVLVEDAESQRVVVEHKRVAVPSLSREADHPFTIEIPVNWEVRRNLPALGVFFGPPGGDPNSHPEMLLVHESEVALDAPEAVLANLRANAQGADWSLREAEVRDFGSVRGLWIVREMPPSGLHGQRVSFAVKLPLGERSLDVLATVPREVHDALAPAIGHMLQSIRPAEPPATEPES